MQAQKKSREQNNGGNANFADWWGVGSGENSQLSTLNSQL